MSRIFAPWDSETVNALTAYQNYNSKQLGRPWQCPERDEDGTARRCKVKSMVPTPCGWVCLGCGYRSNWVATNALNSGFTILRKEQMKNAQ